jgi:hypothetical protein
VLNNAPFFFTEEELARIRLAEPGEKISFREAYQECLKKQDELGRRCRQAEEKMRKAKAELTVNVIKQNQAIDSLVGSIETAMGVCRDMAGSYNGQRELIARTNMALRVMASAIGMLRTNKLKLWMIDDRALPSDDAK